MDDVGQKGRLLVKEAEATAIRQAAEQRKAELVEMMEHLNFALETYALADSNWANLPPWRWHKWWNTHREVRGRLKRIKQFETEQGLR